MGIKVQTQSRSFKIEINHKPGLILTLSIGAWTRWA